jgi:hypothetical protein
MFKKSIQQVDLFCQSTGIILNKRMQSWKMGAHDSQLLAFIFVFELLTVILRADFLVASLIFEER